MNRSLSVRSGGARSPPSGSHRFTFNSLRGNLTQPELSKKLFKLIKTENNVISAVELEARELRQVATQLSDWGEETADDAVSDISDKIGVLMSEHAEVEDNYASSLEESRLILKHIRNMETSVAPARDHKTKITDQIHNLKHKEPNSPKVMVLEQELVRAEAEELVANAQLTNVTRQKLKDALLVHFAAVVERSEKQAILARHGRRLLELLDDTPVVPGDTAVPYSYMPQAKQVLLDAEQELETWEPEGAADISVAAPSVHNGESSHIPAAEGTTTTSLKGGDEDSQLA